WVGLPPRRRALRGPAVHEGRDVRAPDAAVDDRDDDPPAPDPLGPEPVGAEVRGEAGEVALAPERAVVAVGRPARAREALDPRVAPDRDDPGVAAEGLLPALLERPPHDHDALVR